MSKVMVSQHFSLDELASRDDGSFRLEPGFIDALEILRNSYNHPMIVTSGCRTIEYNAKIGGHPRSLHMIKNPYWHTDTCAVDIKRPEGYLLHKLIHDATILCWSIGIANTFVHLDRRTQFLNLQPVIYTYKK